VHQTVTQTKERSGWPAKRTLAALGVSRRSYYRWLKEEKWAQQLPTAAVKPVQAYEALPEEKEAVLAYARRHPELRHRELAWRMVDEDVACLSMSTVYRLLKEAKLVCPWRRRSKRRREEEEKATRPNQVWATDLMYVHVGAATYFFVSFLDEYSRYVVHHELLIGMDGLTVSLAAQAAIDRLPKGPDGLPASRPLIRSDNGSGYVSHEFKVVLKENGLDHQRIKPHCPEENGVVERSNRTIREHLEGEELTNLVQAQEVFGRIIRRYNEERLHSALGYLRPADYYRGDPAPKHETRRLKMAQARHRRRERNLQLEQRTLPYAAEGTVANA
jgi:transposase InsO family protein